MTVGVYETEDLLEAAVARLDSVGYAAIPWGRTERAAIATEALRRAAGVLREGGKRVIHPLGFNRIPLSAWTLDRPRIAVHVWSRDFPEAHAFDIHDHCYDFVSICIAGEIRHTFFDRSDSPEALSCNALSYRAGCCAESESALGEDQRIMLVDERTVAAFDALSIQHSTLHQARPMTNMAVTVQFQSPCIKTAARVFRTAGASNQAESGAVELRSREWLASLLENMHQ